MDNNNLSEIEKLVLNTLRDFSTDTIYFKDKDSKFLWNTKGHAIQVGATSPVEMHGKSDYDFFPEEFADKTREDEIRIMETEVPVINRVEELIDDSDESTFFMASKYPLYNDKHEVIGTWGMSKDVTEQMKMERELSRSYQKVQTLARVDDLSGLYNRRYFYEAIERYMSLYEERGESEGFSIISIDVDDMTSINDQHGQPCGDEVLRYISSSMVRSVRKADICFRIGGDEFMVLLPDSDKLKTLGIAKTILGEVSSQAVPLSNGRMEKVTISLGVASYEKGMNIADLMSLADRKLYKSKRNGKNQVSF